MLDNIVWRNVKKSTRATPSRSLATGIYISTRVLTVSLLRSAQPEHGPYYTA